MDVHAAGSPSTGQIGQSLNVLGALLSIDPADQYLDPVLAHVLDPGLAASWSYLPAQSVQSVQKRMIASLGQEAFDGDILPLAWKKSLHEAFRDLFVGPAPLAAPPWGSVYLAEEPALYGVSTMELKDFLSANGISAVSPDGGPEDHFGTLCLIGAWLAAQDRLDLLGTLLGEHVLPWGFAYLDALGKAALAIAQDNPPAAFYSGGAELAASTLHAMQEARAIPATKKPLYHPQAER